MRGTLHLVSARDARALRRFTQIVLDNALKGRGAELDGIDFGEVVGRLRPGLLEFRDEQGRTLYDLPDAPRPAPDTPAPIRFVPDFDNLLLSHADRSRIISEEHRKRVFSINGIVHATFLVDGFVHGTWKIEKKRGEATLRIDPFDAIPGPERRP